MTLPVLLYRTVSNGSVASCCNDSLIHRVPIGCAPAISRSSSASTYTSGIGWSACVLVVQRFRRKEYWL